MGMKMHAEASKTMDELIFECLTHRNTCLCLWVCVREWRQRKIGTDRPKKSEKNRLEQEYVGKKQEHFSRKSAKMLCMCDSINEQMPIESQVAEWSKRTENTAEIANVWHFFRLLFCLLCVRICDDFIFDIQCL